MLVVEVELFHPKKETCDLCDHPLDLSSRQRTEPGNLKLPQLRKMPREIVTVQLGQCGNQSAPPPCLWY
jgi:hypothetical protein